MTREAFEKTVRAMKAEGLPLTMPNLMVRTELPRATIEDWLAGMERPVPKSPGTPGRAAKRATAETDNRDEGDMASTLLDRVADLKNDLARSAATAVVRDKLGLGDDDAVERVHGAPLAPLANRELKDLRWGAGLGLLAGPLGLFYSAPLTVAGAASAVYLAAIFLLRLIPIIGTGFLAYLLPLVHIAAAAGGAAYTWRYNRTGKRAPLLPDGGGSRRRRRRGDDA